MPIQSDISLRPFNTFHLDEKASRFAAIQNRDELEDLFEHYPGAPALVLGGGSNILLTKQVDGLVLKNEIRGIEEVSEDEQHVFVKAGAGENWHAFVLYCIGRDWAGLENLSLIPGCVGAAPIQNIGAYGVELKEVFYELEAFDISDKKIYTFGVNDCGFGYRDSIFKSSRKGRYIILSVTFILNKIPTFHTSYGAVDQELRKMGVTQLSIKAISQAVINIRSSKLPDPAVIGNAGSFFKNPSVPADRFASLQKKFPGIIGYKNEDGTVKLAAGWLVEQCGWKGYRRGDAGVHTEQALVLVNYGNATGSEIYRLSEEVAESVKKKFGVALEREVNVV
jgi:UDP-N-acetylmuramate dehydrogenase